MLDAHCQAIMDEYLENQPTFEVIKKVALGEIGKVLKSNGISVNGLEGRIKTQKSLSGKLELKGYKYNTLSDITDIVGTRVITFYTDEVDKIAAFLEKYFEVDWENSVDKRKALEADRFGYLSLHYICRIPKSVYYDEAMPKVNEYRFEIQIRTALQHVWATANHDSGYKTDVEIPAEYTRRLNRLAGLLEIADQQFSSLMTDITNYRRKVFSLVKDGRLEELALDGDTFRSYIDVKPFEELNEKIAALNKAEIQPQNLFTYFNVFKKLGFTTIGGIDKMRKENENDAYRLAALQIGDTDLDILSESIGIQNLCIVYIVKNGGDERDLKEFFDILYGEKPRNLNSAKRVLAQAKSINL